MKKTNYAEQIRQIGAKATETIKEFMADRETFTLFELPGGWDDDEELVEKMKDDCPIFTAYTKFGDSADAYITHLISENGAITIYARADFDDCMGWTEVTAQLYEIEVPRLCHLSDYCTYDGEQNV